MNDLDYLLNQLNLLIGFLDVSDEQVYHQIKHHDRFNMGLTIVKTIKEKGNGLIPSLAEEQARRLTFAEKIKFIEKHLHGIAPQILIDIKFVNDIRNCLMHHNGLADKRLNPKYQDGQKIILNSGDVNGYGLQARQLAKEIWDRCVICVPVS